MAKILLAEDSSTHSALIRSVLEQDSHHVSCVRDGREAINTIESFAPDLLITDLRMPEVNGQELVQHVVEHYPNIPSIVVTARGSENLAVDALALGAVNFVPKNSVHSLLNHVVRQTLRMSQADSAYRDFPGRLRRPEFSFRLKNRIEAIEPMVLFAIQAMAASSQMNPNHRIRVGTALASAIFNSLCYGILEASDSDAFVGRWLAGNESGLMELRERASNEAYRSRTVDVKVSVGDSDTRILVAHTGNGRITRLTPAPGTPESFELEQCRGLMLMTSFMDNVVFHSGCTEVVMVKRHPK
jgi:CheY-like chemotaxis protein